MKTQLRILNPRAGDDALLGTAMVAGAGFVAGYATGKVLNMNPWVLAAIGSFIGAVAVPSDAIKEFR